MRILSLKAEQIKRLEAVHIKPDGSLIEITGRNAQGKTSVLDSIWMALGGDKAIPEKPIRDGADKGVIEVDLGAYKVTRTFKAKEDGSFTKAVTITTADGIKASNPTEILKGIVGELTFDPLAFAHMKADAQVKALRSLVPGFDFAANDKAIKDAFEARTAVNRRVGELEVQVSAIEVPEDAPLEAVSFSDLTDELQAALDHNSSVDRMERQVQQHEASITATEDTVNQLKLRLKEAELRLEELRDVELGEIPERKDIDAIRERIGDVERLNALYAKRARKEQLQTELDQKTAESEALTQKVDDGRKAAADAVRAAQLPVDGLELTEDSILLNGQPFSQASDAEQLRASVAIAGAMNPKLRVMLVRDGSLLDRDSMALLAGYAELHDLQVWCEVVESGRPGAIVIEDGHIVERAEAAE
ncbi:DNA repair exonuclease SbcCD ATPase subunit [Peteryoungia aggregata LMG 23059]|uniref:DNA repair exonuclease SbcCD ATPase subunit n=1 Tax=Peteryoungia aggregata LMG 23059 TaxID=1368425 RepID=A0ABU0GAH9_9HYPH|nr:AAA family ATPase [Peteryoungia aggregata]MDQ0422360.1 DNA repair exonuclease SbcCD ATPase subunit [Peteryoungia aggregata LMG 23059]